MVLFVPDKYCYTNFNTLVKFALFTLSEQEHDKLNFWYKYHTFGVVFHALNTNRTFLVFCNSKVLLHINDFYKKVMAMSDKCMSMKKLFITMNDFI